MKTTVTCSCGHRIQFKSEPEFYGLLRRHILAMNEEKHRFVSRVVEDSPAARSRHPALAVRRVHRVWQAVA